MRHKNHVSLIGMVGRDAEVRTTQGGVQYARFSLATSSGGYVRQDGQQVPETTQWHNITAWRNLADFCGRYVKKGMKIDVEGMIVYSDFMDNQGQKRQTVEIVASDIVLMSMPQSQQQGQRPVQEPQQPQQPRQFVQQPQFGGGPFPPQSGVPGADDLPF